MSTVANFLEKIFFGGIDGCWIWKANKDKDGYGLFQMIGEGRAHRISYLLFRGHIPPGNLVCHKCDNPSCVNPSHLFVGTVKDNQTDMSAKGRGRKPGAKTRCKYGHDLTGDNAYIKPNGSIHCRICDRTRIQKYREKNRHKLRARSREMRRLGLWT